MQATPSKPRRARRARSESDRKKHAGWRRCPRCSRSVSTNGRNFYHHMHKCDRIFFADRIAEADMLRSARRAPRVALSQLQRALFVQQLSFLRVYDRVVDRVCADLERSDPNLFRTALFQAVRDAKSRPVSAPLPSPLHLVAPPVPQQQQQQQQQPSLPTTLHSSLLTSPPPPPSCSLPPPSCSLPPPSCSLPPPSCSLPPPPPAQPHVAYAARASPTATPVSTPVTPVPPHTHLLWPPDRVRAMHTSLPSPPMWSRVEYAPLPSVSQTVAQQMPLRVAVPRLNTVATVAPAAATCTAAAQQQPKVAVKTSDSVSRVTSAMAISSVINT